MSVCILAKCLTVYGTLRNYGGTRKEFVSSVRDTLNREKNHTFFLRISKTYSHRPYTITRFDNYKKKTVKKYNNICYCDWINLHKNEMIRIPEFFRTDLGRRFRAILFQSPITSKQTSAKFQFKSLCEFFLPSVVVRT